MAEILMYGLVSSFILFGIILVFGGLGTHIYAKWKRYAAGIFMIIGSLTIPFQATYIEKKLIKKYEGMNLIEFYKYREDHPLEAGMPNGIGFITENVNLRQGPSAKKEILQTLSVGEKVNLTFERHNEWFQINYKGQTGWIHGKYVRPIQFDEEGEYIDSSVILGFSIAVKGAFPEKSVKDKVIGYCIGFVLSSLLAFFLYQFFGKNNWVDGAVGAAPIAYFLHKNLNLIDFSLLERNYILVSYIIVSIVISMPIEALNLIVLRRLYAKFK